MATRNFKETMLICWIMSFIHVITTLSETSYDGCPSPCQCTRRERFTYIINCSDKDMRAFPFLGDFIQNLKIKALKEPATRYDHHHSFLDKTRDFDDEGENTKDIADVHEQREEGTYNLQTPFIGSGTSSSSSFIGHEEVEYNLPKSNDGNIGDIQVLKNGLPKHDNVGEHTEGNEVTNPNKEENSLASSFVIELYANNNSIQHIMHSTLVFAKNRLRILEILDNRKSLEIVPGSLDEIAESLEILKMDSISCDIRILIRQLSKLHQLRELHLSLAASLYSGSSNANTNMESCFFGLDKLKILHLSNSRIYNLHSDTFLNLNVSLEELNLSQNKFTSFPSAVTKLMLNKAPLKKLDLSKNHITALKWSDIPKDSCYLVYLDLSTNEISEIDVGVLKFCVDLMELNLKGNVNLFRGGNLKAIQSITESFASLGIEKIHLHIAEHVEEASESDKEHTDFERTTTHLKENLENCESYTKTFTIVDQRLVKKDIFDGDETMNSNIRRRTRGHCNTLCHEEKTSWTVQIKSWFSFFDLLQSRSSNFMQYVSNKIISMKTLINSSSADSSKIDIRCRHGSPLISTSEEERFKENEQLVHKNVVNQPPNIGPNCQDCGTKVISHERVKRTKNVFEKSEKSVPFINGHSHDKSQSHGKCFSQYSNRNSAEKEDFGRRVANSGVSEGTFDDPKSKNSTQIFNNLSKPAVLPDNRKTEYGTVDKIENNKNNSNTNKPFTTDSGKWKSFWFFGKYLSKIAESSIPSDQDRDFDDIESASGEDAVLVEKGKGTETSFNSNKREIHQHDDETPKANELTRERNRKNRLLRKQHFEAEPVSNQQHFQTNLNRSEQRNNLVTTTTSHLTKSHTTRSQIMSSAKRQHSKHSPVLIRSLGSSEHPVRSVSGTDAVEDKESGLNLLFIGSRMSLFACILHAVITFLAFLKMDSGRDQK